MNLRIRTKRERIAPEKKVAATLRRLEIADRAIATERIRNARRFHLITHNDRPTI